MDDIKSESIYIPHEGKMVVKTTYDNTAVIESNKNAQNTGTKSDQYKGRFVHAGKIHMGDIERLRNMGYDLLSPDPDEIRRAYLYIQIHEPYLLRVKGKPFAKKRAMWT